MGGRNHMNELAGYEAKLYRAVGPWMRVIPVASSTTYLYV